MEKIYKDRLERLRSLLQKNNINWYLETDAVNIFYLTGFRDSSFPLLVGESDIYIFLPKMLREQFGVESAVAKFIEPIIVKDPIKDSFTDIIKSKDINNLAFPFSSIKFSLYLMLASLVKCNNSKNFVERLRLIKDDIELEAIREASRHTFLIAEKISELVEDGDTELDLLKKINIEIMRASGENAFKTVVASGRNAAYPHHVSDGTRIDRNEVLLVDFGVKYNSYCSDLTRVFFLDKISNSSAKIFDIYKIVKEIQAKLIDNLKPGIQASEIDLKARKMLSKYKLDQYFTHGLGHGLGLDIHEAPRLSSKNTQELEPGMVVTIEPGIYIKDIGGVRIEDTVLITDNGTEVLTKIIKNEK